jgi:hypothetical protein
MFNLDKAIDDWRKQMLGAGMQSLAVDELESHLREGIASQTKSRLNAQQAFEAAVREIGKADMLNQEFKKNGNVAVRSFWTRIFPVLTWAIVVYSFGGGSMIVVMGLHKLFKTDATREAQMVACAAVAVWFVLVASVIGWRWTKHLFPVISSRRIRGGIGAAFVLLATGCLILLTQWDIGANGGLAMVLWFFTLMLGLAVAYAGLEDAARMKSTT